MPRTISADMTIRRKGLPIEVLIEARVCKAEPEVGYANDYLDDVGAFDEKGKKIRLSDAEHEEALTRLTERLD